jgi:hypothetical protein
LLQHFRAEGHDRASDGERIAALERAVAELRLEFRGFPRRFEQGGTVNRLDGPTERTS